jgi:hypothetical protein
MRYSLKTLFLFVAVIAAVIGLLSALDAALGIVAMLLGVAFVAVSCSSQCVRAGILGVSLVFALVAFTDVSDATFGSPSWDQPLATIPVRGIPILHYVVETIYVVAELPLRVIGSLSSELEAFVCFPTGRPKVRPFAVCLFWLYLFVVAACTLVFTVLRKSRRATDQKRARGEISINDAPHDH